MFTEVAAKHPFPEYPPLLQLLFGWSGFDESLQKPQHLAVFLTHCTNAPHTHTHRQSVTGEKQE